MLYGAFTLRYPGIKVLAYTRGYPGTATWGCTLGYPGAKPGYMFWRYQGTKTWCLLWGTRVPKPGYTPWGTRVPNLVMLVIPEWIPEYPGNFFLGTSRVHTLLNTRLKRYCFDRERTWLCWVYPSKYPGTRGTAGHPADTRVHPERIPY